METSTTPLGTSNMIERKTDKAAKSEKGADAVGFANHLQVRDRTYLEGSPIFGAVNGEWYRIGILVGGRGVGKTFLMWEYILNKFNENFWVPTKKFYWLRSTDAVIDALSANYGQQLCPYIGLKLQKNVQVYTVGKNIYMRKMPEGKAKDNMTPDEWDKWKQKNPGLHVGYLLSISGFYNDKGTRSEDDTYILFYDEVNREVGERKTFNQAYAFVNQIETLVRTKRDVRIFLMGNTIDEASDLLQQFNFIPKDGKYGTYRLRKKRAIIFYIEDSEKMKELRKESLSAIISDGQLSSLSNTHANSELFTPQLQAFSDLGPKPAFIGRCYFTRTDFVDVYSSYDGIWIGARNNFEPKKNMIIVLNPRLDGVVPYNKDVFVFLKTHYQRKTIKYQNMPIAVKFVQFMEQVGTLK